MPKVDKAAIFEEFLVIAYIVCLCLYLHYNQ